MSTDNPETLQLPQAAASAAMPQVIDQVALARLYGEPLFTMPSDLYIPIVSQCHADPLLPARIHYR